MSEQAYFMLTAAMLVAAGLYGAISIPRMITQRISQGLLPPSQARLGKMIRILGVILCLMGVLLVVMEIVAPLKR